MDTDVIKLIESKHEVTILGSNLNEFCVKFYGPRGTSYEGSSNCTRKMIFFIVGKRDATNNEIKKKNRKKSADEHFLRCCCWL